MKRVSILIAKSIYSTVSGRDSQNSEGGGWMEERYLSARRAAEELGVSLATLYAYVRRGMVRSEAVEGKGRNRRYRAEDVRRLRNARSAGGTLMGLSRVPCTGARLCSSLGSPWWTKAGCITGGATLWISPRRGASRRSRP